MQMLLQGVWTEGSIVPCHVKEKFKVVTCHLHIVYISNPLPSRSMPICLAHLLVDESWLRRSQPKVIVRTPPIAQMVIHTRATLASLLLLIRQTSHIAIVVVAPYQSHVFGHLQTIFINLQHFLIRYKSLRDAFYILSHILPQHLTLIVNYLLQPVGLLFQVPRPFHVSIMNASHTNSIDIFILPRFLQARNPVVLHLFPIGEIVESSSLIHTPFRRIVTHHRFTMTRSHNDATTVRHCHRSLHLIERHSTLVHGRPNHIAPQSQ